MKFELFAAIFLIGLSGCLSTGRKEKTISNRLNQVQIITPIDTLVVKGKAIVFFTISQEEYDVLEKDSTSGIDEIIGDYNNYAYKLIDTIKYQGYKPIMTNCRYIQVILDNKSPKIFDRLSDPKCISGYIFTNGVKVPEIEYGVDTDDDLQLILEEFNKKVNLTAVTRKQGFGASLTGNE